MELGTKMLQIGPWWTNLRPGLLRPQVNPLKNFLDMTIKTHMDTETCGGMGSHFPDEMLPLKAWMKR